MDSTRGWVGDEGRGLCVNRETRQGWNCGCSVARLGCGGFKKSGEMNVHVFLGTCKDGGV